MKAVRMTAIGEPLALQEIPAPTIGPGDVLVRVKAAGICHSDAHYRAGTSSAGPLPLTLGHEVAGVVEAIGAQCDAASTRRPRLPALPGDVRPVRALQPRPRAVLRQAQMIGKHRDGGYAEYIAVPERSVVPAAGRDPVRARRDHDVLVVHVVPRAAQGPPAARRDGRRLRRGRPGHVGHPAGAGLGRAGGVRGGHQPGQAGAGCSSFGAHPRGRQAGRPGRRDLRG